MSLFSEDIITSDPKVPLKEQFAFDISNKIRSNYKDLIYSMKTHGVTSVMNCIEMYVSALTNKDQYRYMNVSGRSEWDSQCGVWGNVSPNVKYKYRFVTYIKGDIYIVVNLRPFIGVFYDMEGAPTQDECFGTVIIILDERLREKKFKVK